MQHDLSSSIEVERAVAGLTLVQRIDPVEVFRRAGVRRSWFESHPVGLVFDTAMRLWAEDPEVGADPLLVIQRLKQAGDDLAWNPAVLVMELAERAPIAVTASALANELRGICIRRSLRMRAESLLALSNEVFDSDQELVGRAMRVMEDFATNATTLPNNTITTLDHELVAVTERMQDRHDRNQTIVGLTTGLDPLDRILGGLRAGQLIVIAGRPGMGKTALGDQCVEAFAKRNSANVLKFNFEMSVGQQAGRALARNTSIDLKTVLHARPSDAQVEQAASEAITHAAWARLVRIDAATDLTVDDIRERARSVNRDLKQNAQKLDAILIDYLQLIKPPRGMRADNENAVISHNSRQLKQMAIELELPVLLLSQLNRSVEAREDKTPRMSDLRGSGSIEQDADAIILLHRPEYYDRENTARELRGVAFVDVAKIRDGEPGETRLGWSGEHVRFTNTPVYHAGVAA